ncbi:MAG: hypothetical protein ABSE73_00570 [Planctomycetota bacterium]
MRAAAGTGVHNGQPDRQEIAKCAVDTAVAPDTLGEQGALPAWIDDALLRETQRVWSKQYGRDVSVAEATEILLNVRRLAKLLVAHRNDAR